MGIQVDSLTKNKTRHQKEFIDFEFDGRSISEFGMVAVFDGDRHSFNASPTFEDEISDVNGVDGQYYWGTKIRTINKTFDLATDGMTEQQVNDFKLHFRPGKYGKFIENKLACRYGYCRIAEVISFSVVPFKKIAEIKIQDTIHQIEINEYKGSAKITFVFDKPYFYATRNMIPLNELNKSDSLRESILNGTPIEDYSWTNVEEPLFIGEMILSSSETANKNKDIIRFYNPSTASTEAQLILKFQPQFTSTTPTTNELVYFSEIADNINSSNYAIQYNSVIQENKEGKVISEFLYTSPNIINQINRTIATAKNYYLNNMNSGWTVLGLEEALRLEITNPKVIGWATAILRLMKTERGEGKFYNPQNDTFNNDANKEIDLSIIGGNSNALLNWLGYFNVYMLFLLADWDETTVPNQEDTEKTLLDLRWVSMRPYEVCFDSELSQTTIEYSYNSIINTIQKNEVSEEKCGDMICSAYLKLDGGDFLDNNCHINKDITHVLKFKKASNFSKIPEIRLNYKYTYL